MIRTPSPAASPAPRRPGPGLRRAVHLAGVGVLALAVLCGGSCSDRDTGDATSRPAIHVEPAPPAAQSSEFEVRWPLIDPVDKKPPATKALLKGRLTVQPDRLDTPDAQVRIRVTLTRPDDEEHREFWNESLVYREFGWMRYVRVWDDEEKWLYPNLAFLSKLHGVDREERYGGWDPGKRVDNDFGALLIRKYDAAGKQEHRDTATQPLVSADWHAVGAESAGKRTVVHRAESDLFTIHLSEGEAPYQGRIKLWFVYADFMGHRVPDTWPKEPEFNGGTIALFHVDWRYEPGTPCQLAIAQQRPPSHTGFDWREWVDRRKQSERPLGEARLADR